MNHRLLPTLWLVIGLLAGPGAQAAVVEGEAVPALVAPYDDGRLLRLNSLRGQVVLLDFWASWCAPCRVSLPAYDELQQQYAERGFTVVAVNVDRRREDALRMLERTPVSFPVVFDPMSHWARRFELPGMPTAYLIDREGVVRMRHVGYRSSHLPGLVARIEALLEEETP